MRKFEEVRELTCDSCKTVTVVKNEKGDRTNSNWFHTGLMIVNIIPHSVEERTMYDFCSEDCARKFLKPVLNDMCEKAVGVFVNVTKKDIKTE